MTISWKSQWSWGVGKIVIRGGGRDNSILGSTRIGPIETFNLQGNHYGHEIGTNYSTGNRIEWGRGKKGGSQGR